MFIYVTLEMRYKEDFESRRVLNGQEWFIISAFVQILEFDTSVQRSLVRINNRQQRTCVTKFESVHSRTTSRSRMIPIIYSLFSRRRCAFRRDNDASRAGKVSIGNISLLRSHLEESITKTAVKASGENEASSDLVLPSCESQYARIRDR